MPHNGADRLQRGDDEILQLLHQLIYSWRFLRLFAVIAVAKTSKMEFEIT